MKYYLMNKNMPVLECEYCPELGRIVEILRVFFIDRLPLAVKHGQEEVNLKSLNLWLWTRGVPASNRHLEKYMFWIAERGGFVKESLMNLSLSDQYWLNPEGKMSWSKVNLFQNKFSDDIGYYIHENNGNCVINIELQKDSKIGWLKKKWKIINGQRWLIKAGSLPLWQEPYNEVIATELAKRMNITERVEYSLLEAGGITYCMSRDFIDADTEYVPASHIIMMKEHDSYNGNYRRYIDGCIELGLTHIQQFINKMLIFDYIMGNSDRHFGNFGLIRNVNSLKIEGAAPIFDTGSSLFCDYNDMELFTEHEMRSKPFASPHGKQIKYVTTYKNVCLENIDDFPDYAAGVLLKNSRLLSNLRVERVIYRLKENIVKIKDYAAKENIWILLNNFTK